jgi:hypothetical protein
LAAALEVQGEATRADKGFQDRAGRDGAVLNRRFGQSAGAGPKKDLTRRANHRYIFMIAEVTSRAGKSVAGF